DELLRDEIEDHLSLLKRQGLISAWHDRMIGAGDEWKGHVAKQLAEADIIILLVSPSFMASDYCWDVETKLAIERHERGEAVVIPIILRPCDWHGAPFGKLQVLPADGKPVTLWSNRDESLSNIAQGLRKAIEQLSTSPLSSGKVIRIDPVDLAVGTQEGQRVRTILLVGSASSYANQGPLDEVAKRIGQRLRRTKNRAKF